MDMDMMETVNLSRAVLVCNTFHFCFAAAKASLIPFMTIFCRMMGLSATETGIIMAIKTATGFIWAPLWSRCAIAYNKRRTVLMFSLFIMASTYLSLSVVFSQVKDQKIACQFNYTIHDESLLSKGDNNLTTTLKTTLAAKPTMSTMKPTLTAAKPTLATAGPSTMASAKPTTMASAKPTMAATEPTNMIGTTKKTVIPTTHFQPVTSPTTQESKTTGPQSNFKLNKTVNLILKMLETAGYPITFIKEHNLTYEQVFNIMDREYPGSGLTLKIFHEVWPLLMKSGGESLTTVSPESLTTVSPESPSSVSPESSSTVSSESRGTDARESPSTDERESPSNGESANNDELESANNNERESESTALPNRVKRGIHDTWKALKGKVSDFLTQIEQRKMQVFVIVLVIIIFGEFFSSPVEKVADDSWFDFLDRVDDLEKYGKQRLVGSLAFILVPVLVCFAVDYTECLLPFNIHHFLIHFYTYGAFMGLALLFAFCYPVPPPIKQKTKSKVLRGLQIVCCDCRGFLYVITLLIMGITYASVHTFLFWVIQDKGGSEVNMGLCVTIGAVAEIPMLMFTGKMVNKIGNSGVVTVSLLAMTVRTIYYSFLEIPWAVLPAEILHAFTHTAMWYAVLSHDDFNVGPGIDRSIRSILSSIYFGIGFSLGSVFSGVIYDLFGSSVMYWAGSALTGIWAIFFFLISMCLPKKEKIKYVRLLRSDDTEDSDDADDWLEMALKDQ